MHILLALCIPPLDLSFHVPPVIHLNSSSPTHAVIVTALSVDTCLYGALMYVMIS
jgi:hypothetical protein